MHSWLVECDIAILANTTQEELDTVILLNVGLVRVTFRNQVFGVSGRGISTAFLQLAQVPSGDRLGGL